MKKIFFILISLLFSIVMHANEEKTKWQVSESNARQKAISFFAQKGVTSSKHMERKKATNQTMSNQDSIPSYYIFDAGNSQGFVIISGDNRLPSILGYTDRGDFNIDNVPENFVSWIKGYEDQINYLSHNEVDSKYIASENMTSSNSAISPLITTMWNQQSPYNNQCPTYNGSRCLTGCTATAMAQVMNYTRWPQSATTVIPAYKTNNQIGTLDALPSTTFDWDAIALGSGTSYETEVSKLMRYCGQALETNYGTGSSSAYGYKVDISLRDYFGYESAKRIYRNNFSVTEWNEMIYNELANSRPVFYDGQSTGGGHAFVVDGYDSDGLFHVNWGWNGYCDGYFRLAVLNPHSSTGSGASFSDDGYSMDQGAVIGISAESEVLPKKLRADNISYSGTTLKCTFWGTENSSYNSHYGFAIMDNSGELTFVGNSNYNSFIVNSGYSGSINLKSYLTTAGTYDIVPVCRTSTSDKWVRTYNENVYATVTVVSIDSITCTLHPVTSISVNSISVDGDKKLGSTQEMIASIKNGGDDYTGTLYLFMSSTSDKGSALTMTGIAIARNTTEDYSLYFSPTEAGNLKAWIALDSEGSNVIGQTTITITSDQTDPSDLTLYSSNVSVGNGYAKITFYVKNNASSTYGRPLVTEVVDTKTNEKISTSTITSVTIYAGGSSGWIATRYGLDDTKIYSFNIYAYKYANGTEQILVGSVKVVMPDAIEKQTYNFSLTSSSGGSIVYGSNIIKDTTCVYSIESGASATLNFVPDDGYELSTVTLNDKDITTSISNGSFTISNITSAQSIVASYAAKVINVSSITLSKSSLNITKGKTYQLSATIIPNNATNKDVTWESTNTSVATVSSNGLITAVSVGNSIITVTSVDGGDICATCEVTVTDDTGSYLNGHEYVDLGLPSGVLWATTNVGATKNTETGTYVSWGETAGATCTDLKKYTWSGKSDFNETHYKFYKDSTETITKDGFTEKETYSGYTKYVSDNSGYKGFIDNKNVLDIEDDFANTSWGGTWRIPTETELKELKNNCTWKYGMLDDTYGCKVIGPNGNWIFLPASGLCYGTGYTYISSAAELLAGNTWRVPTIHTGSVNCWTSTINSGGPVYLNAGDSFVEVISSWIYGYRYYGHQIRAVSNGSTGINHIFTNSDNIIIGIYNLNGEKLNNIQKGINIIKYKNGITKKIIIK